MKKFLWMVAAITMAFTNAHAQRIEVVDSIGNPVAYAAVMTPEAVYIGTTNMDGVLADAKGAKDIVISHIAYQPKEVTLNGTYERIMLEHADFIPARITIQPKPYIYVQTYYRMYMYSTKKGIVYHRAGLTDNVYDINLKKVKASTTHVAKSSMRGLKFALGLYGTLYDRQSRINANKLEDRICTWGGPVGLKITEEETPGKQVITDTQDVVGYIADDYETHLRRFCYDATTVARHIEEVKAQEQRFIPRQKRKDTRTNREENDFCVYQFDDYGEYAPEDFVMSQCIDSYDIEYNNEEDHRVFVIQVFATERAYVTREEIRQRKMSNKMKLTYENIMRFERRHNIPALPASLQEKLKNVWHMDE